MSAASAAAASVWLALAGGVSAAVGPAPISLAAPGAHPQTPAIQQCLCAVSKLSPAAPASLSSSAFPAAAPPTATLKAGTAQTVGLSANGAYTALPPTRLLDTRLDGGTLSASATLNLTVTGGSVPAGASAVALNVTVTNTTAASYLSVYPTGDARPLLSNLNWVSGETVPNLVIVPVGINGQVTFFNDQGQTDIVVDLEGYFAPQPSGTTAGSYVPLAPSRITDTRPQSGEPYSGDTLGPGGSLDIQVAGEGGIPVTGVAAALLNVTITNTTAASFLTAYPEGTTRPLASNLNWVGGETVANRVVVPVNPSTGEIAVYNEFGNADLVIDVDGYFTNGASAPAGASLLSTITPVRILDTRTTGQTLGPGGTLTQQVAGIGEIPATATAVVANVTAADTTASSYFTVYPGGARPLASDLNWSTGQTVANLDVATLGSGWSVSIYNNAGNADLIIDAFSYFGPRVPLAVTTTTLPAAATGTAYSTPLEAEGGVPPYSWAVTSGGMAPGLGLSGTGVLEGTPTTVGSYTFTVQATDSETPVAGAAAATLTLEVYLGQPVLAESSNWSGYAASNGPYTSVTGTFDVPSLYSGQSGTYLSEWVGIDGLNDTSLIQAGIQESPDPYNSNYFYIRPWWEILPAAETPVAMTVSAGDLLTVTIQEYNPAADLWAHTLTDDTSGATFTTDQTYAAPLSSAEWIVEAPMANGVMTQLAAYTTTTFTNLSTSGPQNQETEIYMVQNGVQVSTPSALNSTGFSVAYEGAAPPAP
jgi:hypothetical protein